MSYMFYDCGSLISLSKNNDTNVNTSKLQIYIINMSYMFYRCKSLISLPDISKWNTSNVEDMSFMLYKCNSLISIPDISKWNTSNINNMNNMFFGCKSSLKLLDLYILNKYINNIIFELTYKKNNKGKTKILDEKFIQRNRNRCSIIYNKCEFELKEYFDDIDNKHKDKIKLLLCLDKNINDLSYIFYKCDSLISVEYYQMDYHIKEMNDNFGYKNFFESNIINSSANDNINLYDAINIYSDSQQNESTISQIKTNFLSEKEDCQLFSILLNRLTNISGMFWECKLLISLPDISKWNTSNAYHMNYIFKECNSLISLPDISKWNTYNKNK